MRQQLAVDEVEQLGAGAAFGVDGPVTPAERLLDRRPVVPVRHGPLLLAGVERLQEEEPGELRHAVEVAVQACVLAHDVAGRLDRGGEPRLRRRLGGCRAAAGHQTASSRTCAQKARRVDIASARVRAETSSDSTRFA